MELPSKEFTICPAWIYYLDFFASMAVCITILAKYIMLAPEFLNSQRDCLSPSSSSYMQWLATTLVWFFNVIPRFFLVTFLFRFCSRKTCSSLSPKPLLVIFLWWMRRCWWLTSLTIGTFVAAVLVSITLLIALILLEFGLGLYRSSAFVTKFMTIFFIPLVFALGGNDLIRA